MQTQALVLAQSMLSDERRVPLARLARGIRELEQALHAFQRVIWPGF